MFGSGDAVSRPAQCNLGIESLGLKTVFPLVGTLGHEWVPERTPEGAERSAARAAERSVVQTGSRGTLGLERGN